MGKRLEINGTEIDAAEDARLEDVLEREDVPADASGTVTVNRDGQPELLSKQDPVTAIPEDEQLSVGPGDDYMLG